MKTKCDLCGSRLIKIEIENHGAGGWFHGNECEDCGTRYNVTKFSKEDYQLLRNRLNRRIATLKKATLKQ